MRRLLIAVAAVGGLAAPASADNEAMCQRLIETTLVADFSTLVSGCEPGDVLVLQITPNVAPAPIVGRFCDLRRSIWDETRPADGSATIVCVFNGVREPRRPL